MKRAKATKKLEKKTLFYYHCLMFKVFKKIIRLADNCKPEKHFHFQAKNFIPFKKILPFAMFILGSLCYAKSGKAIRLWKDVPDMKNEYSVMYAHRAEGENTGIAVIVCPGGSYHHLGLYNEGFKTSEWFSKKSVTAFTLRYRTSENGYHYPAMLQDLQRAIQLVRENADEYGIDVNKVGTIGYSAGGHLVTMGGAFWESHDELKNLGIEHEVSLKPDFVIPVYPVVSMQDEIAHKWSRKSLLGKNPSEEKKNEFSMEMQIPSDMSPTYIVACKDDDVVDYRNSLALHDALKEKNIPCRLTVYEWGKHGFGMLDNGFMKSFRWNEEMWNWISSIFKKPLPELPQRVLQE